MDSLLKSLSLSFLLRSVFAGAFFVISYQVAACGIQTLLAGDTSRLFAVALPVSLFVGFTIYALHRSLLYPIVEFLLESGNVKRFRQRCPLIRDTTVDTLIKLWGYGAKPEEKTQEHAQRLAAWADVTHFNYLSALCIGAGAAFRVITAPGNYPPCWPLIFLAVAFTVAGLTSDWRLKRVRELILERENAA